VRSGELRGDSAISGRTDPTEPAVRVAIGAGQERALDEAACPARWPEGGEQRSEYMEHVPDGQ
jgi:hypothetical protein